MSAPPPPATAESPAPPPRRPRRWWAGVLWGLFLALLAFLAIVLIFPAPFVQRALNRVIPTLEAQLGLDIDYNPARLTVFGNTLTLHEVVLADPDTGAPIATADSLELKFRLNALVRLDPTTGQAEVAKALRGITLHGLTLRVARTPQGFDVAELFAGTKPGSAILPWTLRLTAPDARIEYTDYPLRADGSRDWQDPRTLALGMLLDAQMQQGVLTSSALSLYPIGQPDAPVLVASGGAHFRSGYALTIAPHLTAADLQPEGLFGQILPALSAALAAQVGLLESGDLTGQLLFVSLRDPAGTWPVPKPVGDLQVTALAIRHPVFGPEPVTGDLQITLDPVRWRIPRLQLTRGATQLTLTAAIDPTQTPQGIDAAFLASGLQLSELPVELPFAESVGYQGSLTAQGRIRGTVDNPQLDATLTGDRLLLAGSTFQLEPSRLRLRNGIAEVQVSAVNGPARLLMQGTTRLGARELAFQLQARQLPASMVRRVLPALRGMPLEGLLDATLLTVTTPDTPNRTEIEVSSRNGMLGNIAYGQLLGRMHTVGKAIVVDRLIGTLPGDTEGALIAWGEIVPGGAIDLQLQLGGLSLRQLWPDGALTGQAFARVHVQGTPQAPAGTFTAQLIDGTLQGIPYIRLYQSGSLTPTALTLDASEWQLAGTELALTGGIDLAAERQIDLALAASGLAQQKSSEHALDGAVTLRGTLAALDLAGEFSGDLTAFGHRLRIEKGAPLTLEARGLGLAFPTLPRSWEQLAQQLGATGLPPLQAPVTVTESGAITLAPLIADASLYDPFFAAAIRNAAPELAPYVLEADPTASPIPPIRGTIHTISDWTWDGATITGSTDIHAATLEVGEATLSNNRLRLSRPVPGPLLVSLTSQQDPTGALNLIGTVTPASPITDSPLNLALAIDDYPLAPLLLIAAPGLATQIDGIVAGGGLIRGTLGAPATIPYGGDDTPALTFTIREGRLGTLEPLAGTIEIGYIEGQLQIHRLNLQGPEEFELRGAGTVYLSRDEFSSSNATFDLAEFPLASLRPFFGVDPPELGGTLNFTASYAFVGGVPGVRGTLRIAEPRYGTFRFDQLQAILTYNPFTRRVSIEEASPIRLQFGGHELQVYGRIAFPEDQPLELDLIAQTLAENPIPLNALLASSTHIATDGGIEGIFLTITGTPDAIQLNGDVDLALSNVRFFGERVATEIGGIIHFTGQRIDFINNQFQITNESAGQRGTALVEGSIDWGAIRDQGRGEIGMLRLRPETPGGMLPLSGFGLQTSLRFPPEAAAGGARPLAVRLTDQGITLSGDLLLGPGNFNLGQIPDFTRRGDAQGTAEMSGIFATPSTDDPTATAIAPPAPINFDLAVRIPAGFEVRGPSDLEVTMAAGTLQIEGNPLAPLVTGTVQAPTGSLAVLGKEFRLVERATLTFNSIYGLNPHIRAVAQTRVDTLDPRTLAGRKTVTITVTVNAYLQDLGAETGEGLTFTSDDASYSTPSQILVLLAGFGGDRGSTGDEVGLGERVVEGLSSAAVSIPGQFVGRFFEEQGFRRFLIGADIEGDIFVDMEYEVFERIAVDYRQTFGGDRDWQAGVKYEIRDNSFVRLGTTEDWDLVGSLEYRIPLGRGATRKSRAEAAAELVAFQEREAAKDLAAQTLPADYVPLDDNMIIESHPGAPEVVAEVLEDEESAEDEADAE